MELIDETFQIRFNGLVEDFRLMSEIVKYSDSYTRFRVLTFEINKDYIHFSLFLERHKELPDYIKKIKVYVRKLSTRSKYDEKKIQEFKNFILKKFKKELPEIEKWEIPQ